MADTIIRSGGVQPGEELAPIVLAKQTTHMHLLASLDDFATEVERDIDMDIHLDRNPPLRIARDTRVFVVPKQDVELSGGEITGHRGDTPRFIGRESLAATYDPSLVATYIRLEYDGAAQPIPDLNMQAFLPENFKP